EIPRGTLVGKASQWYDNVQVVEDELAVKISEAEERLYVLDLVRLRPIADVEFTFLWLHVKAVKLKLVEYLLDMLLVALLISGVDWNIIKVDDYANIQHVHKDGIQEVLEGSQSIGEAERHYQPLIGPILSLKCSLSFITWGNPDEMVGMLEINLCIDFGSAW
ncbi:hypothetical protein M404DRAFT_132820, partial [Pisolithus tinctorius Marx 270]